MWFDIIVTNLTDFGHGGQPQWRLVGAGRILAHTCVCEHRCTPSSLTLSVRWDGSPARQGRDLNSAHGFMVNHRLPKELTSFNLP